MCLVNRHAHTLVCAIPHLFHALADETQLRRHLKCLCQAGGCALSLEDGLHFFADLLQVIEHRQTKRPKEDHVPTALACSMRLRTHAHELLLRCVDGRQGSHVTIALLAWLCQQLAAERKRVSG